MPSSPEGSPCCGPPGSAARSSFPSTDCDWNLFRRNGFCLLSPVFPETLLRLLADSYQKIDVCLLDRSWLDRGLCISAPPCWRAAPRAQVPPSVRLARGPHALTCSYLHSPAGSLTSPEPLTSLLQSDLTSLSPHIPWAGDSFPVPCARGRHSHLPALFAQGKGWVNRKCSVEGWPRESGFKQTAASVWERVDLPP